MAAIIEMQGVGCRFPGGPSEPGVTALDGVDLAVRPGQMVAVMGTTGSGKSTLLNCAAGLQPITAGRIRLFGGDVSGWSERRWSRLRRDRVGFVFQAYNLLPDLTVRQNVLLPCRLGARSCRDPDEVLGAVGLAHLQHRRAGTLSGGQQQRVAVARALIARPGVLFADEPTGALDPVTGAAVLGLLREASDGDGVAVLLVTHDPAVAARSDRLVLLSAGRLVDDRPTPDTGAIAALLQSWSPEPAGTPAVA